LHPDLLHHPGRRQIVHVAKNLHAIDLRLGQDQAVQGLQCLGHVALAPVGPGDDIAGTGGVRAHHGFDHPKQTAVLFTLDGVGHVRSPLPGLDAAFQENAGLRDVLVGPPDQIPDDLFILGIVVEDGVRIRQRRLAQTQAGRFDGFRQLHGCSLRFDPKRCHLY